jgi:enoyl-[acyl-carrier protein] reductase II
VVINTNEGDTMLTLKELTPVRLIRNEFFNKLQEAYQRGASAEELKTILGRGRAKKGMFEGDLVEGELEIGQIAGIFDSIMPAHAIVEEIIAEFRAALNEQQTDKFNF